MKIRIAFFESFCHFLSLFALAMVTTVTIMRSSPHDGAREPNMIDASKYYSLHDAATLLPSPVTGRSHISYRSILSWVRTGRIGSVQIGGRRYVRGRDLIAMLEPENETLAVPSISDAEKKARIKNALKVRDESTRTSKN
jgi:hypothetical protein